MRIPIATVSTIGVVIVKTTTVISMSFSKIHWFGPKIQFFFLSKHDYEEVFKILKFQNFYLNKWKDYKTKWTIQIWNKLLNENKKGNSVSLARFNPSF